MHGLASRPRLSSKQREALWQSESARAQKEGRGKTPICPHCDLPVAEGTSWDAAHDPQIPNWMRPRLPEFVSHPKCNKRWAALHDVPKFAKTARIRRRYLDLKRSLRPLPGGREDRFKKLMSGKVVLR